MLVRFLLGVLTVVVTFAPAIAGPRRPDAPPAQDEQVKIEVKFITIAEDFFERIGVDFSSDGAKRAGVEKGAEVRQFLDRSQADAEPPIFLNEDQKRAFLESLAGDMRTNIAHTLKMIVSNGKLAVARRSDKHLLATNRNVEKETFATGFELSVRPKITADRRAIALDLKTSLNSLDFENRQPRLTTLSLEEALTIPANHTVLLGGWKRMSEGRVEYVPPALSKIPYVNRLFRNVGYTHAVESVLVMVTAKIVRTEARATSHREEKGGEAMKNVAKLMAKYHRACSAGQLDKARKFARRALTIDPTCFETQPVFEEIDATQAR